MNFLSEKTWAPGIISSNILTPYNDYFWKASGKVYCVFEVVFMILLIVWIRSCIINEIINVWSMWLCKTVAWKHRSGSSAPTHTDLAGLRCNGRGCVKNWQILFIFFFLKWYTATIHEGNIFKDLISTRWIEWICNKLHEKRKWISILINTELIN